MAAMTALFCLMLALAAAPGSILGRKLDASVFRKIGAWSYGIFLWQYPVIFLFQYMKWGQETAYPAVIVPLMETTIIVLLTIWSDCLVAHLSAVRHMSFRCRRVVVNLVLITLISMPGFAMMGYGCKGLVESAEYKAADTAELKERLQENEEALRRQDTSKPAAPVKRQDADLNGIACIGDSVMLGSAMELQKVLPDCYIDAKVSRYVGAGVEIAQKMDAEGRLGSVVVVALGTNGPLDGQYEEQTKGLLEYLGPDRHIFWVNVYCPNTGWQDSNNAYLETIAEQYPNVTIIDWCGLISKHPEWLAGDGVHPEVEGTKQYAKLVRDVIAETLSQG